MSRSAEPGAVVAEVRRRLDEIGDPCSVAQGTPMGLDEMGLIEAVAYDEQGHVDIQMRLTSPCCMMVGYFKVEAEKRVREIPGVSAVAVHADRGVSWRPEMMSADARRRRREALLAQGMPAAMADATVGA